MKKLLLRTLPGLILLLGVCISSHAQNEISGIILTKEATKYFQAAKYKFIKVANDGTTKPVNGYKMFYNKKDKSVLIAKHHTNPPQAREYLLRGGADFFCTKGCEEEGCVIEKAKKGVGSTKNSVRFECIGCYKEGGGVELCEGSLIMRKVIYRDILR